MKIYHKQGCIIPFLAIILLFSCQSQKKESADAYCHALQSIEDTLILKLDSFFLSTRFRELDTQYYFNKATDEITIQWKNLNKIGFFKKDSTLFHSLNSLFIDIHEILQNDGNEIVKLDENLLLKYDKQKINRLDSLESIAIDKIYKTQLRFDSVMVEFLHHYGFDVERDSTQYERKNEILDE